MLLYKHVISVGWWTMMKMVRFTFLSTKTTKESLSYLYMSQIIELDLTKRAF